MAAIEFVEHKITATVPELTNPTNMIDVPLSVRVDPLTGRTSRVITGTKLAPSERPDLSELTATPPFCPFCADKVMQATGTFDPKITDEGRIKRGSALIVPNVMAYSEYSSVGLYDTEKHFLDLPELTGQKVADLLRAFVDYTKGVHGLRPMWSSVNANYLPPSGSSLVHPHGQSAHDDIGTTGQRRLVAASKAWGGTPYWQSLVETERDGERWIGQKGRISFFTPFAPGGFHEVWAVIDGAKDIVELTDEDCQDLGEGMSNVFAAYCGLNLTSFNWAIAGGGPNPSDRYSLLVRIVSRSNAEPMYRSDVTYFEKLHDEAMVDVGPEAVAAAVRPHFK